MKANFFSSGKPKQKPANCRVNFDANVYDRNGMRAMLDRYLRLMEVIAGEPELPLGKLMMMMRWDALIADVIGE